MLTALSIVLLASSTLAQQHYTVWGSVIYNRAGEAGPDLLGVGALTSVGAQQSYTAGQFFRERYITSTSTNISGLNPDIISLSETYVLSLDTTASIASAQAFMQGFYPPFSLRNNASTATKFDPTSVVATGDYIEAPLGGYQYPQIHVAGALDPDYIFIGGNLLCPSFIAAESAISNDADYQAVKSNSANVYMRFASLLNGVLPMTRWNFDNAYEIYNYISYLAEHNSTTSSLLQGPSYVDPATGKSYLITLKGLADQQQQFVLTNKSAMNVITGVNSLPYTAGSISTIAGNQLAGKILTHLSFNNITLGNDYKVSFFFGSFEPIMSLLALMGNKGGSNFSGIAEYASSAVFELYSLENSTNPSYPSGNNLRVSFSFRNGSSSGIGFSTPMAMDYAWDDFVNFFTFYYLGDIGDWCLQCGANRIFCAAYNTSLVEVPYTMSAAATQTASKMSPVIAGVIGAIVALAVAFLLFGLVMLIGGIRFHRRERKAKNADVGGYKGSAKLASDQDLTLPKNGVTIGTDEVAPAQGHERMGSWEMKAAAKENRPLPRYSMEDVEHASPVEASERV